MYKRVNNWLINWIVWTLVIATCSMSIAPAQAQQKDPDSLPAQFSRYQASAFQEKVFVHTDKTFYLAGETLWFKAYDVDAYFNRPMPFSDVIYVEVTGQDRRPVFQARIAVREGAGNGSWSIPASITSGNYILRAYTAWMKNFSPEFYFQQPLSIVNTVNASGVDTVRRRAYDIQFFPEGGHLVQGFGARLAFKVVDQDGNGVDCDGALIDQRKDTLVRFRSNRFGMGSFVFTPQPGEHYIASIKVAGDSTMTRELPVIDRQGYTLQLEEADRDRIKITVRCTPEQHDGVVYLFTHTRHLFKNFRTAYLTNGQTVFFIEKAALGDGISHITLFNSAKRPVCERLYFKLPERTMHLAVQGLSAGYPTRQKIELSLLTTDPAGQPVTGDLSMSVFLLDSLQSVPQQNILNYFLLTSDLRGWIECPQWYFDDPGSATAAALDDLMLTQGWTRFNWENILGGHQPIIEFAPEINGPVINGKIIDKRTNLPAPSVMAYLSAPGRYFEFSTAVSRPDGSIHFHTGDWIGKKELIIQSNSRTDSNYRVDMGSPFSDKSFPFSPAALPLHRQWENIITERSVDVQVENSYRIPERHRYPALAPDTVVFYGRPDLRYLLADYTKFATLEEVMKEYVGDVRLRRQSGKFFYRVRNAPINLFFEEDPLLLLDGLPVFDADKLLKLDPARIREIDILTRKYFTGPLENEGIISYRSLEGDLAGYPLDPDAVVIEYNGLQQAREFYTPVYDTKIRTESRLPDFRNQLQWSPAIRTDAAGKSNLSINTSMRAGKYALVIQGMTRDGLVGATVLTFNVTK